MAAVVAIFVATAAAPASADAAAERIARGKAVLQASGGCTCHTDVENDGAPLAGGRPMQTPFGVFYSTNITPDPETGIGAWSDADFVRAMREGRAPDGSAYFPTFPYTSFTGMTDADVLDLKAYLFSLAPVRKREPPARRVAALRLAHLGVGVAVDVLRARALRARSGEVRQLEPRRVPVERGRALRRVSHAAQPRRRARPQPVADGLRRRPRRRARAEHHERPARRDRRLDAPRPDLVPAERAACPTATTCRASCAKSSTRATRTCPNPTCTQSATTSASGPRKPGAGPGTSTSPAGLEDGERLDVLGVREERPGFERRELQRAGALQDRGVAGERGGIAADVDDARRRRRREPRGERCVEPLARRVDDRDVRAVQRRRATRQPRRPRPRARARSCSGRAAIPSASPCKPPGALSTKVTCAARRSSPRPIGPTPQ